MIPIRGSNQNAAQKVLVAELDTARPAVRAMILADAGVRSRYHELYAMFRANPVLTTLLGNPKPATTPKADHVDPRSKEFSDAVALAANYKCVITGEDFDMCDAAHIFAHHHNIDGINGPANGLFLSCTMHRPFDRGHGHIHAETGATGGWFAFKHRFAGKVVPGYGPEMAVWLRHNATYWLAKRAA